MSKSNVLISLRDISVTQSYSSQGINLKTTMLVLNDLNNVYSCGLEQ